MIETIKTTMEWHDLEKHPENLPKNRTRCYVLTKNGRYAVWLYVESKDTPDFERNYWQKNIVAWAVAPMFRRSEEE